MAETVGGGQFNIGFIGGALDKLREHLMKSEQGHYSGKTQQLGLVIDSGLAEGFCLGNIIKYASRHKRKGDRDDLLKIAHYALVLFEAEGEK